ELLSRDPEALPREGNSGRQRPFALQDFRHRVQAGLRMVSRDRTDGQDRRERTVAPRWAHAWDYQGSRSGGIEVCRDMGSPLRTDNLWRGCGRPDEIPD